MKNKTKIIIILAVILIVWSFFLFTSRKQDVDNNNLHSDTEEDFFHGDEYPTEEELLEIYEIWNSLPKPLENYIPDDSLYSITYNEGLNNFVIKLNGQNAEEYEKSLEDAFGLFFLFGLNPCEKPLLNGISWLVDDWSKADFEEDPLYKVCEKLN